jgi:hypothetical protein
MYNKQVDEYKDLIEFHIKHDIIRQIIKDEHEYNIHDQNSTNEYRY